MAWQFTVLNFTQPEPRRVVVRWRMEWPFSKAAEEYRQRAHQLHQLQVRGHYCGHLAENECEKESSVASSSALWSFDTVATPLYPLGDPGLNLRGPCQTSTPRAVFGGHVNEQTNDEGAGEHAW